MATPKLDEYAMLVNDVLRYKLKLQTIPTIQYFKNPELYNQITEDVYVLKNLKLPNGINVEEITFQLDNLLCTECFFELNFENSKQLLWNLTSYEYYKEMYVLDWGNYDEDNGYYLIDSSLYSNDLVAIDTIGLLTNKYTEWKQYCKFLDDAKHYIQTLHPEYEKLGRKQKNNFIELLSHSPFTKDIATLLDNYSLNQFKQAKIDKLLQLELPNISDDKIATQLTNLYIQQT